MIDWLRLRQRQTGKQQFCHAVHQHGCSKKGVQECGVVSFVMWCLCLQWCCHPLLASTACMSLPCLWMEPDAGILTLAWSNFLCQSIPLRFVACPLEGSQFLKILKKNDFVSVAQSPAKVLAQGKEQLWRQTFGHFLAVHGLQHSNDCSLSLENVELRWYKMILSFTKILQRFFHTAAVWTFSNLVSC